MVDSKHYRGLEGKGAVIISLVEAPHEMRPTERVRGSFPVNRLGWCTMAEVQAVYTNGHVMSYTAAGYHSQDGKQAVRQAIAAVMKQVPECDIVTFDESLHSLMAMG